MLASDRGLKRLLGGGRKAQGAVAGGWHVPPLLPATHTPGQRLKLRYCTTKIRPVLLDRWCGGPGALAVPSHCKWLGKLQSDYEILNSLNTGIYAFINAI